MSKFLHNARRRHRQGYDNISMFSSKTAKLKRGNRDNLGIIFSFFYEYILCDPSLELSRQDNSNEALQHIFSFRNKKNYF